MLYNLSAFLKLSYVKAVLENPDKFEDFCTDLNTDLKKNGFAAKFFLKSHYNTAECFELLKEITATVNTNRKEIKLVRVETIPDAAISDFIRDARIADSAQYIHTIKDSPIKIAAMKGFELVGYTVAWGWGDTGLLHIPVIFVHKDYRRMGIAQQLIYSVIREARHRKLRGIDISKMVPATDILSTRLLIRWAKKADSQLTGYIYNEDDTLTYARIIYKDSITEQEKKMIGGRDDYDDGEDE